MRPGRETVHVALSPGRWHTGGHLRSLGLLTPSQPWPPPSLLQPAARNTCQHLWDPSYLPPRKCLQWPSGPASCPPPPEPPPLAPARPPAAPTPPDTVLLGLWLRPVLLWAHFLSLPEPTFYSRSLDLPSPPPSPLFRSAPGTYHASAACMLPTHCALLGTLCVGTHKARPSHSSYVCAHACWNGYPVGRVPPQMTGVFISHVDRGPSSRLTEMSLRRSTDRLKASASPLCGRWERTWGFLVFQLHFKILIETHQLSTYFYVLFLRTAYSRSLSVY